ncbi:MAG: acyltransferase [Bizionia sp.]|nr:acyltransferase [Bizionia sp.]
MRIEQLTFTRFIAAISIVVFHYGKGVALFYNEYTSFIFEQANVGVSYFFVLSGFVMIIAYREQFEISFFEFIKNRIARIYPVYLLAILLILSINFFQNINKFDLVLNLFMLQSWVSNKALTLNFTGWSLSVELFFYVSFPFLFNFFYSKKHLKSITVWIISFFLISQIVFYLINNEVFELIYLNIKDIRYYPLMHFNEFLVGNLAALYYLEKLEGCKKHYNFFVFMTLIFLIALLKYPFGLNYHNGLLAIVFVPMILFMSLSNNLFTKTISKNIFVFLGEISFSIYILQAPVWIILSDYRMNKYFNLNKEIHFTESFFIRLLVLILLSSVSFMFFEKPLRNRIKRIRTTY